ncbi:CpsD/CapB family tyrosine-protein kinase [Sphingosinicella terrae]|jgi:protein-tyrosine kinase|uniref:CpsD/CapB family tyrosine-protein kinase n=1 Tax=Sphingosinicella terrae TaxID=2172047 RepID=UPI000E0DBB94|nr:CpsD/CapB family tyrosine-protein kinase [Sphingosinicella terrae]
MKHDRISLIERAAEVYDFGAALRARTPATDPMAAPPAVAPAPASPPAAAEVPPPVMPVPPSTPRPAPAGAPAIATVDRQRLAAAGYLLPDSPSTGLAEEFRLIKRQLLAGIDRRVSQPEEKRRSILVTSAQSQDGKSFCALNLALSLAGERAYEVLLVDGDFSKPNLPSILGIEAGAGLVDALADPSADPERFVIRTDVAGLSLLPAGRKANDVPELLASERTREVLSRLVAGNPRRLILFDSPPALMASPATVLAGHVGQVLVVVRADRTTEADLRETVGLLVGCDHLSLILNGAAMAVSGRNFGAYYGHSDDAA